MLVLGASDIQHALSMSDAIAAVAQALVASSGGEAVTPIRTNLPVEDRGSSLFMPSYVSTTQSLGVKFVSVFPGNKLLGKKTIHGVVVLADAKTAEPIALLEASYLTALRTGAAAGLATQHLAREDAQTLGVIGTGVQARSIVRAIQTVRSIAKILLYNRTRGAAEAFKAELEAQPQSGQRSVVVVDSANEAVHGADILVTATNSITPVFDAVALQPGTHINAVGSYRPDMQELPSDVFRTRPRVVVESRVAALEETGDLIIPCAQGVWSSSELHAELGDIVRGAAKGRETLTEGTIFKSVGLAAMDMVVAKIAVERARSLRIGQWIEL